MKKKLFIVLLVIFFLHLGFRIFQYSGDYLSRYDADYWKDRVKNSQWGDRPACMLTDQHINPKTCAWDDNYYQLHKDEPFVPYKEEPIGDDGLYAYAGWEYIHGLDPTSFNAEIPPLGKYVIGITTIIFGNQNIFALLSGIFVLISLFFLNKIIFKDNFLAFLPVAFLSFDPLFYTQIRAPFLDLLYLGFLLLTFLFFLKERFFVAAIFLGLMMATKASASTFVIVAFAMFAYLVYMKHREYIKKFILSLGISVGVFLLTYSVYFFKGHTPIEFLSVQKWIFNFYTAGAKGDPTTALQMLFTGNWPTWWGEVQKIPEWHILWPISLLACVYYIYKVFPKRKPYPSVLFAFWIVIYLIFLAFVPVWPRYLLLILPFMYTLSVWVLSKKMPGLS